jgi:hypothetical protein
MVKVDHAIPTPATTKRIALVAGHTARPATIAFKAVSGGHVDGKTCPTKPI